MPLVESSLSIICVSVRDFLSTEINAGGDTSTIDVQIGAPADKEDSADHLVRMFFYRFEPSGFQADAHPQEAWRIRLFCLITVFGLEEDGVLPGESDLRILGEILRVFRETPVLEATDVNGETVRLQVIFSPVTDEQINQVWSTQGDATYRPSVVYEMALTAIMPSQLRVEPLLVGGIGSQVRGTQSARFEGFMGNVQGPIVAAINIDIAEPTWQPVITWLYQGDCASTLSFNVASQEFADFNTQIWVAGDSTETIQLQWQIWQSQTGWEDIGGLIDTTPFTDYIDPDNIPPSVANTFPFDPGQPIVLPIGQRAIQGMLFAVRNVQLSPGSDIVQIRSNPLLISLFRDIP